LKLNETRLKFLVVDFSTLLKLKIYTSQVIIQLYDVVVLLTKKFIYSNSSRIAVELILLLFLSFRRGITIKISGPNPFASLCSLNLTAFE